MQLQIEGILRDKGQLLDGTRKLEIECNETSPEQMLAILKSAGKVGWFFFSESPQSEVNVPEVQTEFQGDKTPSQRLRNVLYVYWEQSTGKKTDFDTFYRQQMEKIIAWIKEKLD